MAANLRGEERPARKGYIGAGRVTARPEQAADGDERMREPWEADEYMKTHGVSQEWRDKGPVNQESNLVKASGLISNSG